MKINEIQVVFLNKISENQRCKNQVIIAILKIKKVNKLFIVTNSKSKLQKKFFLLQYLEKIAIMIFLIYLFVTYFV